MTTPDEVVTFWREAGPERWFSPADEFDEACRRHFMSSYERAAAGALDGWADEPDGALALVLLLDQLPRNMFRGDPRGWATDPAALQIATRAIDRGFDRQVEPELRRFFYLPFMHAENLEAQERSVLFNAGLGDPEAAFYARHHRDIVARFGRFPHRNAALGRASTPDETAFLRDNPFGT
jgi:uncharacterized protein (DUF924 family)